MQADDTCAPPKAGVLVPCVLLLLQQAEHDGDQVRELLAGLGMGRRLASLTAVLERLEGDGLIYSSWSHARNADGPGYGLTEAGQRWLAERSEELAETDRLMRRFSILYATLTHGAPASRNGDGPQPVISAPDSTGGGTIYVGSPDAPVGHRRDAEGT